MKLHRLRSVEWRVLQIGIKLVLDTLDLLLNLIVVSIWLNR